MTIESENIILEMLSNGGHYSDDPAPETIWRYYSRQGKQLFAVFYFGVYCDVFDSPYVKNPILLFSMGELTEEGHKFVRQHATASSKTT